MRGFGAENLFAGSRGHESRGRGVGGGHMIGDESEQEHFDQLSSAIHIGSRHLPAHVLDFAQQLGMKFEVMSKKRDPRPGHRRFLTCEVIMKFLRDRVEQGRQFGIRRRRGGVEQPIECGVIAIHEWNAEQRSRRHHDSSSLFTRGPDNLARRDFNGTRHLTQIARLVLDPDQTLDFPARPEVQR
jgi:hypothetical protein